MNLLLLPCINLQFHRSYKQTIPLLQRHEMMNSYFTNSYNHIHCNQTQSAEVVHTHLIFFITFIGMIVSYDNIKKKKKKKKKR